MSNHSNDEKRNDMQDKTGKRLSNPNDELTGKRTARVSPEELLPEKIEKVTESLLSQWEISEDDFEDTQDLTETAARLSGYEAPPLRREEGRRTDKAPAARTGSMEERRTAAERKESRTADTGRTVSASRTAGAAGTASANKTAGAGGNGSGREERQKASGSQSGDMRRSSPDKGGTYGASSNRTPSERRNMERVSAERRADSGSHKSDAVRSRQENSGKEKAQRSEKGDPRQDERAPRHVSSERSRNTSRAQVADREDHRRKEAARIREEESGRKAADTGRKKADPGRKAAERRQQPSGGRGDSRLGYDDERFGNSGHGSGSGKSSSRRKQANPVVEFWNSLHTMDKVVGFTGIFVCIFAVVTFSVLANAKSTDKQVEAFAAVGQNLSQINVADDSIFLAVADAHRAKQEAADITDTDESEEYNEKDDNSDVQVGLNMTSVEKDLKIKFVNRKTGKLVPRVDFQVEIKGPDKTYTKNDDDQDGIIYLTGITPGKYTVKITGPENAEGYSIPSDAQEVTVKDHIEYKKIDVSDEVKKESEVNAAKEDTQVKTQTESVLQDTVEWVESAKTPVGGSGNDGAYVEVKKADVPDPSASASLVFDKFFGVKSPKPWALLTGETVQPRTETDGKEDSNTDTNTGSGEGENQTNTPEQVEVEKITISPESASGTVGGGQNFTAQISPDNAADKSVVWSSSDKNVATVNNGSVTFVGAGTTEIKVASANGKTATASVTVSAKETQVGSVAINGDTAVTVGGTIKLTASVSPDDASYNGVTWSSTDTSIATVVGGTVTGIKAGTVTIKAEAGGVTGSSEITVKEAEVVLKSIKISGDSAGKKGAAVQLAITPDPAGADASVTWKSSNDSVASVDANGKVTCNSAGEVTITAVSKKNAGITATFTFKVTEDVQKKFDMKDVSVTAGQFKNLEDYCTIQGSSSRSFSIENTKYATVDGNGRIKAIRSGETKITVTVKFQDGGSQTQTKKLIVNAAEVKGITLDKTKLTLNVGDSLKLNPTIDTTGYTGCLWYSTDKTIVTVEEHGGGTIKALKPGKVTITAKSSEDTSKTATCEVTVTGEDPRNDTKTPLKDKSGKPLFVKTADGKYVAAVVADYYKYDVFYRENENVEYKYTGWQTIDGKRYYFDKNGNKVTGDQIIQGVKYSFGSDGALSSGSGVLGIDVSKHNGNINWTEVKNSGVSYVIIRCGYRGSSTGALIEDPKFKANVQGATAAGLKVGIYFFTQAVNQIEAVEEASMTVSLIKNYKISYPVFLDVEASGGRADGLDAGTRTQIVNAYCQTIQNSGYTAGVYANKSWLNSKLNVGSLGSYKIWLAQYAAAPTYNGRYDMWQYSSTGKIGGISGNTDLNISYLGY